MLRASAFKRPEYLYLGMILASGFFAIFLFFRITLPNTKLCRGLFSELSIKENELKNRKEAITHIEKLKEELRRAGQSYEGFTQQFFFKPQSPEAVKVITELGKGLKIEFLSLQPLAIQRLDLPQAKGAEFLKFFEKEKKDFFLWEMPFLLKIKGDYANLLQLIKRIEQAARFIRIKRFQIKKDPASPFIHSVELGLSLFSLSGV